jgi:hypothetical protein
MHSTALSDEDIEGMKLDEIYIVLEIRDKAKEKYWTYNDDGTLSGTTDSWFIKIAAYYVDPWTRKPKMADVLCPFAIGFDIKINTSRNVKNN